MELAEFLTPDRVVLDLRARDKPHLINDLSRLAGNAAPRTAEAAIRAALLEREQLGSTGLGGGFALPHARIDGLDRFIGLFARLARPIQFDAIDGKPVDLVFVLLIPANGAPDHVTALAAISRRFRDAAVLAKVRRSDTPAAAFGVLTMA